MLFWKYCEYTPYGETWISEENRTHSFGYRFTGKELDEETNLYYFGARYLDAQTSRWMSADPIYDGLTEGHSIYGYCRNNPLKYIDPNGLEAATNDDYNGDNWGKAASWDNKGNWTYVGEGKGEKFVPPANYEKYSKSDNSQGNTQSDSTKSNKKLDNDTQNDIDKYGKVTYQQKNQQTVYESHAAKLTRTDRVGATLGEGSTGTVFSNGALDEVTQDYRHTNNFKFVTTSSGKLFMNVHISQSDYYLGTRNGGLYWGTKFTGSNNMFLNNSFTFTLKPKPIVVTVLVVVGVYYLCTAGDTSTIQRGMQYVY